MRLTWHRRTHCVRLPSTNVPDIRLQHLQGCLVGDDSGPDIENSPSSSCREFDGTCIAQAGGAGGTGHVAPSGTTTSRDAQPASSVSSTAQLFIFSEAIGLFLLSFLVEISKCLLGGLLLLCCLAGLLGTSVGDLGEVRLPASLRP